MLLTNTIIISSYLEKLNAGIMSEIKPTGVLLAFDPNALNGIDPEALETGPFQETEVPRRPRVEGR